MDKLTSIGVADIAEKKLKGARFEIPSAP